MGKIESSFTPPTIGKFLVTDEWYALNAGDIIFHQLANQNLDLTIDRIGRNKFKKYLSKFQHMNSLIQNQCSKLSVGPCSNDGVLQQEIGRENCYLDDFGCGFKCLDELYLKLSE